LSKTDSNPLLLGRRYFIIEKSHALDLRNSFSSLKQRVVG